MSSSNTWRSDKCRSFIGGPAISSELLVSPRQAVHSNSVCQLCAFRKVVCVFSIPAIRVRSQGFFTYNSIFPEYAKERFSLWALCIRGFTILVPPLQPVLNLGPQTLNPNRPSGPCCLPSKSHFPARELPGVPGAWEWIHYWQGWYNSSRIKPKNEMMSTGSQAVLGCSSLGLRQDLRRLQIIHPQRESLMLMAFLYGHALLLVLLLSYSDCYYYYAAEEGT